MQFCKAPMRLMEHRRRAKLKSTLPHCKLGSMCALLHERTQDNLKLSASVCALCAACMPVKLAAALATQTLVATASASVALGTPMFHALR